jgi:hypothetical protein
MKAAHLLKFVAVMILASIFLSGCGGEDKVGGLSLVLTTEDPAGDSFVVNAGATYTHPTVSDLVNVPITFDTVPSGLVGGFPEKIYTNSSGFAGTVLVFEQQKEPFTLAITATTGDLQDTKVVTIPGLGTLTANPESITFDPTDVVGTFKEVSISGGSDTGTLSASSDDGNIEATADGTKVTITKIALSTGHTAVVTVTDSVSLKTVTINVTY